MTSLPSPVPEYDNLVKILGDAKLLATARVAVIGPVTGEACARNGIKITAMAEKYTIPCLVETIKSWLSDRHIGKAPAKAGACFFGTHQAAAPLKLCIFIDIRGVFL